MAENNPKVSIFSHDAVSIVGGGWSFREVNQAKLPGHVIAVNGAADHLKRVPDEVVTMDRLWLEDFWPRAHKRHAKGETWPLHARNHALKHIPSEQWPEWVHSFANRNVDGQPMTDEPGHLNGTNSGGCAINRAYQLRPKRLYLFGFDMCRSPKGESYWYPHYSWVAKSGGTGTSRMVRWAMEFALQARQFREAGVEVVNVSSGSIIRAFPRVSPRAIGLGRK